MKFRTIGSAAVLIFLLPCVLFILVQSAEIPAAPIQTAMILMLLADVLFCGIWCIRQSEREDRLRVLLFGILSAGMILRIGYMLYTPAWVRGHDVGAMHTEGGGHAAYLLTLLETHGLPQSKSGQFYQQPMYYLLAAPLSYLLNLICGTQKDPYALVDGAKVLSCIAVCYSLALIVPIGRTLKMKTEGICIAAAVTAFVLKCRAYLGNSGRFTIISVCCSTNCIVQTCSSDDYLISSLKVIHICNKEPTLLKSRVYILHNGNSSRNCQWRTC